MGAWLTRPECGLPLIELVGTPNAEGVTRRCAALNVAWVLGAAVLASLVLLILSVTWTEADHDAQKPVIPMWAAAVPAGLGLAYGALAVPLRLASLRVEHKSLQSSTMKKPQWLEYKAANARAHNQVLGSLGAASIIASSVLLE
jgi:bacteriorhodopsin